MVSSAWVLAVELLALACGLQQRSQPVERRTTLKTAKPK
jgi:hypothetical protein